MYAVIFMLYASSKLQSRRRRKRHRNSEQEKKEDDHHKLRNARLTLKPKYRRFAHFFVSINVVDVVVVFVDAVVILSMVALN